MTSKAIGRTSLERNPFWVLGVTTRDDRRRIVERAEERALQMDPERCQNARSELISPRSRLSAEMSWLPGVAPRMAENLVRALTQDPSSIRSSNGLPQLARANLMASALEASPEQESAASVGKFMCDFAEVAEVIEPEEVLRD